MDGAPAASSPVTAKAPAAEHPQAAVPSPGSSSSAASALATDQQQPQQTLPFHPHLHLYHHQQQQQQQQQQLGIAWPQTAASSQESAPSSAPSAPLRLQNGHQPMTGAEAERFVTAAAAAAAAAAPANVVAQDSIKFGSSLVHPHPVATLNPSDPIDVHQPALPIHHHYHQFNQQMHPSAGAHDLICSHLYHHGYLQGAFTDLTISIQFDGTSLSRQQSSPSIPASTTSSASAQTPKISAHTDGVPTIDGLVFNLHRIIAIRSPVLAAHLQEQDAAGEHQLPQNIILATNDPNLTPQGLSIALGHLYGSFGHSALLRNPQETPDAAQSDMERSSLLRSVFASAHFLGLPDLATLVSSLIKEDICASTVLDYCHFASSDNLARYGTPITILRETVFAFLCRGIVAEITDRYGPIWPHKEGEAYQTIIRIFSGLSFEWLKRVVESKAFEVPNDMKRFSFAKQIVELRACHKSTQSIAQVLPGEENVLLSFGGSKTGSSGVTIVRKAPKIQMQSLQYMSSAIHPHHHYQQHIQHQNRPSAQRLHQYQQPFDQQHLPHHHQSQSAMHVQAHGHMQSQSSATTQQHASHTQQQDQGFQDHALASHSHMSTSHPQQHQQHTVAVGGMASAGMSVLHNGIMHMQQPERRVWKAGH